MIYVIEIRDRNKTDINGKPKGITWNTMYFTASPKPKGALENFVKAHNDDIRVVFRIAAYKLAEGLTDAAFCDDRLHPVEEAPHDPK